MQLLRYSFGWSILFISITLGACSAVKLAYNHSDFLLLRYADSYLDLNSEQKEYLRLRLSERLQQHRREELPHLVAFLQSMKRSVADGLSVQEIDELMARIEPIFQTTVAKTIPVFTPVLADLSTDQIAQLEEKMAEKNKQAKDKYLQEDLSERFESRTERITQGVERWTGRVSEDQQRLIIGIVKLWPEIAQDWYDYRLDRQQELLEILEKKGHAEQIEHFLMAWWVEQAGQSPDMKRKMTQLHAGIKTLLLALDASMSEKQRAHLLTRIEDVGADLAVLALPPIQLSHAVTAGEWAVR